jgi:uncharacterized protein with HEPN domain
MGFLSDVGFDRALALAIVEQIDGALETVIDRCAAEYFWSSPAGKERLDGLCMLFMAIGESLKSLDKVTGGGLLPRYPDVDWRGAMGFRDFVAHHYFDIDAEVVFSICTLKVPGLSAAVKAMAGDLR